MELGPCRRCQLDKMPIDVISMSEQSRAISELAVFCHSLSKNLETRCSRAYHPDSGRPPYRSIPRATIASTAVPGPKNGFGRLRSPLSDLAPCRRCQLGKMHINVTSTHEQSGPISKWRFPPFPGKKGLALARPSNHMPNRTVCGVSPH